MVNKDIEVVYLNFILTFLFVVNSIVKYVIHIPGCHGICKRKVVYEISKDGQLIKNGEFLLYKFLGFYSGSILFHRESHDLETFGKEIEKSELKKKVNKEYDGILAERMDNNIHDEKYMLTYFFAEMLE